LSADSRRARVLDIGGGSVGILSGATAMIATKGSPLHRAAGRVFVAAMLVMSGVGAAVAPLLPVPEPTSSIAGAFTFYLVLSAWMTVRRDDARSRTFEFGTLAAALCVIAAGILVSQLAAGH